MADEERDETQSAEEGASEQPKAEPDLLDRQFEKTKNRNKIAGDSRRRNRRKDVAKQLDKLVARVRAKREEQLSRSLAEENSKQTT